MLWFGSPWPSDAERAPVCQHDELRTEVPAGATCGLCPERIKPDDRGVWVEHLHATGTSESRPLHLACLIHDVFPDVIVPPK